MNTTLLILLISIAALALFVLGLSITIIRKGHPIETDVGSNRDMKQLGLECASAQIRREEAERTGRKVYLSEGCEGACDSCMTHDPCH